MAFLDESGLQRFWENIVSKFVRKVDGKDLSSNDFTDEEKEKLDKIEIDTNQNATFPANITATKFIGDGSELTNLDATKLTGIVPAANLPSYVDDVVEAANYDAFPITGETGKIYVALDTNKTYRWSSSTYIEISSSIALGETSSTAYRGDLGAAAYEHAVTNKGSAFTSGLYKITTNSEGHVTGAEAVTKEDITELGIPAEHTWDTLEGKPFGGQVVQTNTSSTMNVPLTLINSNLSTVDVEGRIDLNNGTQYVVYFDNIPYESSTVIIGNGFEGISYLGNLSLYGVGSDNGLPFCIKTPRKGMQTNIAIADTSTSHSIEAICGYLELKLLDEIYIPDSIARKSDIPEVPEHTWESLPDKPFGEIVSDKYYYLTSINVQNGSSLENILDRMTLIKDIVYNNINTRLTVVFNGTEYKNVPYIEQEKYDAFTTFWCYLIGNPYLSAYSNPSITYEDNGLPFCLCCGVNDRRSYVNFSTDIESATLEIYREAETTIKLIDEAYIPENIARLSDVVRSASFIPAISEGVEVGTISINGEETTIFAPNTGVYGSHDGEGNVSIFVGKTDDIQMVTPESIGAATVNHSHEVMGFATETTDGTSGFVPQPVAGDHIKYLRGDGVWAEISSEDARVDEILGYIRVMRGATESSNGSIGFVPRPMAGENKLFLRGDGVWAEDERIEQMLEIIQTLAGVTPVYRGGTGYDSIEDTTYTTARYRASALVDTETDPTTNGVINWTYE